MRMREVINSAMTAMQSRSGRAAGMFLGAALFTFLAGYVVFGPIVLRIFSR
jgi:hypothetical protein